MQQDSNTAENLLSNFTIAHQMPKLDEFSEIKIDSAHENAKEERSWTGEIDDYLVEMSINKASTGVKWYGKAYVQSECGVVLDNIATLPRFDSEEEAYAALIIKVDDRLNKMQKSHITGSFPFIEPVLHFDDQISEN